MLVPGAAFKYTQRLQQGLASKDMQKTVYFLEKMYFINSFANLQKKIMKLLANF